MFARAYLRAETTPEVGAIIRDIHDSAADRFPVTWLHKVELPNALQLYVFFGRQPHHERVTPEQAAIAHATFREDCVEQKFLLPISLQEKSLTLRAQDLCLRHTAKHGFRTYDLLHVSSALLLGCDPFITFDAQARRLAILEGMDAPLMNPLR